MPTPFHLIYNGTDIIDRVSINACVHESFTTGESDRLDMRFNDPTQLWHSWKPSQGDTIELKYGTFTSGKMFVWKVSPTNGLMSIGALALPLSFENPNHRSWNGITLLTLAKEIAAQHGLGLVSYGVEDQTYNYLKQDGESDLLFLSRRCMLEGLGLLVYNGNVVIYDELFMESKPATSGLYIGIDGCYEPHDYTSLSYGSAEIVSGA